MANIKSSQKDIRRIKKRRIRNHAEKSRFRTFEKKVLKSIEDKNKEEGLVLLQKYFSYIDKAAKKNLIHFKYAARKKSKLTIKLNSI